MGKKSFSVEDPVLTFDIGSVYFESVRTSIARTSSGLSLVVILGISVGAVVIVLILVVATIVYCAKEMRRSRSRGAAEANRRAANRKRANQQQRQHEHVGGHVDIPRNVQRMEPTAPHLQQPVVMIYQPQAQPVAYPPPQQPMTSPVTSPQMNAPPPSNVTQQIIPDPSQGT